MSMKPMSLNLKNAQKVHSDQHSSTFQLQSGHQIKILHAPLSNIHRKQIEQMPIQKMASGGDAGSSSETPDSPEKIASDAADQTPRTGVSSDFSVPSDKTLSSQAAVSPAIAPAGASPQHVAVPTSPTLPDIQGAYNQGQNAITEQQGVSEQQAKARAGIEQADIAQRQKLSDDLAKNTADFQQHQQQFMKDYADHYINPNHYVENMSVPQKTASAIGMILGGAGAGAGRPNPGVEFLNNQINRDIAAQESRMGQQKTILEANQALYHDNILANNATRMNMNDIYDHQLQQAAAKIGTPLAKANADAAHSAFTMQNAQLLQTNAMRQTALKGMQNGTVQPEQVVPYLVPPEHQKEALKEIAQAKAAAQNHQFLMDQFDKAAQENTLVRTGLGIRTPPSIIAMNANELPLIHDLEGRVNEFEQKTLQSTHPAQGDFDSKIAAKRVAYDKFISSKMQTPTLDAYAPGLGDRIRSSGFSPQQQNNLNAAMKNNPGVPRDQIIAALKQHGRF